MKTKTLMLLGVLCAGCAITVPRDPNAPLPVAEPDAGEPPCGTIAAGSRCATAELLKDGVLDVRLEVVKVTGRVTLNGSSLPDVAAGRGRITFVRKDTGDGASIDLGTTGSFSYALTLSPAVYDVVYQPRDAATYLAASSVCLANATAGPMPCNGGVLFAQKALQNDGTLDLDLKTVTVTGRVTRNKSTLVDATLDRGQLAFDLEGGGIALTGLELKGTRDYKLVLIPGSYQVRYVANGAACTDAWQYPCGGGPLKSAPLNATGVLDVDVPVIRVTGKVSLEGSTLPNETVDRGVLEFTLTGGDTARTAAFGTMGAVSYSVSLLPGQYAISHRENAALCADGKPHALACNGQPVGKCLAR